MTMLQRRPLIGVIKTCGILLLLSYVSIVTVTVTATATATVGGGISIVPDESSLSLRLIDVETKISPISTLFINKKASVIVEGLVWSSYNVQNTTTQGNTSIESNQLTYSTWINEHQVSNGTVRLSQSWSNNNDNNNSNNSSSIMVELPSSIDVGVIEANNGGSNSIRVVFSNGYTESSTTLIVRSYRQWLSSIPILVAFGLFLVFKVHMIHSLFIAMIIGSSIVEGSIIDGFRAVFNTYLLQAASDSAHVSILLFIVGISAFMVMVKRSGGTAAVMKAIKHHSSKTRVAQLGIFITGVFIFFDPYVSIMVVGKVFGSILKGFPLSAEKVSFLIDTTAMPVASIFPKSSWIMFAADLIQKEIDENAIELNDISGYSIVLSTIKYQFYPIFILGLIALQLFTGREMGPILEAENQSRLNYNTKDQKIEGLASEKSERSWNWYIPVLILNIFLWFAFSQFDNNFTEGNQESGFVPTTWVTSTMATIVLTQIFFLLQKRNGNLCCLGDYFNGSDENRIAFLTDTFPSASGSASIPFEPSSRSEDSEDFYFKSTERDHQKTLDMHREEMNELEEKFGFGCLREESLLSLQEGVECLVHGATNAVHAIISLIFAWATGYVYRTLGIDRVVVSWILSDAISTEALPIVVFLVAFLLSLIIGSSWCTISILIPGAVGPLVESLGDSEVMVLVLASILSGAAAGDHIGPFSETTILSALVTGTSVHRHFVTQAPYAIFVISLSLLVGTVPTSFGAYPDFVCFILGFFVLIVFVIFACRQVKRYQVSSGQSQDEPIARIIHSMLCPERIEFDESSDHHQLVVESLSDECMGKENQHSNMNETSAISTLQEGTEIVKIGNETSFVHGHTLQSFKTKLQEINDEEGDPILGLVEDGILPENFRSELQSPSQGHSSNNFSGGQKLTNETPPEDYENKKRIIEATIKKAEKDGNIFSDSLRVFLRTAEQKLGNIMEDGNAEIVGSTSADSSGDDSLDNLMSDIAAKGWRARFNDLLGDSAETVTSTGEEYTTDGSGSFLATDDSATATSYSSAGNGQSSFYSANGDATSLGSTSTGPSAYSTGISTLQSPLQFNKSRKALQTWADNEESSSGADDECTETGDYTKASF